MMKRILPLLIAASLLLGGCRKSTSTPATPSPRIVSHSPAITDLLYGMELGDHVVGVTNYCMPPGDSKPAVVGDRINVSAEAILAVKPDFVLIQQDPKAFGAVTAIRPDLRIEHMTIETLDDVAAAMDRIGEITGKSELTGRHRQAFTDKLQAVREKVAGLETPSVLLVGGYEHPFTGGKGTFVDEMIAIAGGLNAASLKGYSNWPSLNRENIQAMKPEVLICQVSPG
ncbi:hypothetical protein LCGC14_2646120, partial [marine sediment metagenome]